MFHLLWLFHHALTDNQVFKDVVLTNIFRKKDLFSDFCLNMTSFLVHWAGIYQTEKNCCQVRPYDKIMPVFDWPGLWKRKNSVKRFDRYIIYKAVSTLFLQVGTSTAFSKCFGPVIITIVEFKLKILKKKNHLNFP